MQNSPQTLSAVFPHLAFQIPLPVLERHPLNLEASISARARAKAKAFLGLALRLASQPRAALPPSRLVAVVSVVDKLALILGLLLADSVLLRSIILLLAMLAIRSLLHLPRTIPLRALVSVTKPPLSLRSLLSLPSRSVHHRVRILQPVLECLANQSLRTLLPVLRTLCRCPQMRSQRPLLRLHHLSKAEISSETQLPTSFLQSPPPRPVTRSVT